MKRTLAVLLVTLSTGCSTLSSLDGFRLPEEARQTGATFLVRHQPEDGRDLDKLIAETLRARGLSVVRDGANGTDYIVTYIDRWQWDMRMYLIDLRIDVRKSTTDVLVGTARSYQNSLSAMGETHLSVVERTVDVLIYGARETERLKTRKRRRR